MAFWPPHCATSLYNMLYAPHRKARGVGDTRKARRGLQGYVFINFLTVDAAECFRGAWHGRIPNQSEQLPGLVWSAPLEISMALAQGFEENMRSFKASNLDNLDAALWPVVLVDGQRRNFADVARSFHP